MNDTSTSDTSRAARALFRGKLMELSGEERMLHGLHDSCPHEKPYPVEPGLASESENV